MNGKPSSPGAHGQSSSIERLHSEALSPRSRSGADYPRDERDDTVEMSLLGNGAQAEERLLAEEEQEDKDRPAKPMSKKDKQAMTLLIVLCELVTHIEIYCHSC